MIYLTIFVMFLEKPNTDPNVCVPYLSTCSLRDLPTLPNAQKVFPEGENDDTSYMPNQAFSFKCNDCYKSTDATIPPYYMCWYGMWDGPFGKCKCECLQTYNCYEGVFIQVSGASSLKAVSELDWRTRDPPKLAYLTYADTLTVESTHKHKNPVT